MPRKNISSITNRLSVFLRRPLTSLWLSYFIYWAGAAAVMPYISVYYESVHLKGSQIGLLSSIPYFLSMVSSIVFAFISDISKQHKLVLRLCAAGMIVVMFIFPSANNFAALLPGRSAECCHQCNPSTPSWTSPRWCRWKIRRIMAISV